METKICNQPDLESRELDLRDQDQIHVYSIPVPYKLQIWKLANLVSKRQTKNFQKFARLLIVLYSRPKTKDRNIFS